MVYRWSLPSLDIRATMDTSDRNPRPDTELCVTRREGVRVAALTALAAGLGVPGPESGTTVVGRIQIKFFRALADGGALVGTVELPDAISAFLASSAGVRGTMKWFDGAQQVATIAAPQMCCIKRTP